MCFWFLNIGFNLICSHFPDFCVPSKLILISKLEVCWFKANEFWQNNKRQHLSMDRGIDFLLIKQILRGRNAFAELVETK